MGTNPHPTNPSKTSRVLDLKDPASIFAEIDTTANAGCAIKEGTYPSTAPNVDLHKPSVKNRLALHYNYWEETLCAPNFVLSIIKNGYILPFVTTPPKFYAKNNQSSLRHKDFVESEIENCLRKSYIVETDGIPYCCNPLTVAEGKKLRLVLDLRHVNPHLKKSKFKYEDLDVVTDILQRNDYFTIYDLVSAYYHIDIHPDFHQYLGFHWTFPDGTTRYFRYTVLVFGLSTACYVFTKVMRALITHWRLRGIRILFYLDDGFNIDSDLTSCLKSTETVTSCLERAGFLINYEKSELSPKQVGEWLGVGIDTRVMMYFVPERKIEKLRHRIADILTHSFASSRSLSKITGTLSSMERSLGPLVSLMTRCTHFETACRPDWDSASTVGVHCLEELRFWFRNIIPNNGYSIKRHHPTSQIIIYTDASDHSYGGYILHRLGKTICQSRFPSDQIGSSSTNRELLAIKNCLHSFADHIKHESVEVRTDNINAARIIEKGSRRTHLQDLAVQIFEICIRNDILIRPTWIPREQNRYADSLSKLSDTDDWTIDNETFTYLCQQLGHPQFDRFADDLNCKVPKFNSLYCCPNTSGVNAFAYDWSDVSLNWLCPPVKLICSTLHHMRLCHAKGILLVPQWPSSHYWLLLHNGTSFSNFIKDYRIVDPYYYSSAEKCNFKGFMSFHAIAFLVDFS